MPKYSLKLSVEAEQDLDNLYEEGFIKWGEMQADKYYDELLNHFDNLCDNPLLYRAVDEIQEGYRRSVYGKHSVFYRIENNAVEIMGLIKHQNRYFSGS